MLHKRPHHKSRFGCDQCRKRRVKCDEKLPRCTSCTQRKEKCIFSRLPVQQGPTSTPNNSGLSRSTAKGRLPPNSSRIAVSQVALMHHWCTRTCHSFTPQGAQLFREFVGSEALRHSFLMDALLGLTLLHIASETEDCATAAQLVTVALHHQNQSSEGLRAVLPSISPSNCDAVYICSLLVMACGLVSPLLPSRGGYHAGSTTESLLRVIDFMNGISSIIAISRSWIMQGPLSRILDVFEPKLSSTHKWPPAHDLRSLISTEHTPGSEKHCVLDRAIQELERVFRRDYCAVVWTIRVDDAFLQELQQDEPMAKVIFMHWGVLLYIMDDMWWKRFSGRRLVQDLSATLAGRGSKCDDIIRWGRQQVGLPILIS